MQLPIPLNTESEAPRKSRMHADERHRQLLRVAIEVFARNGFSGTKTKDIAAAAGVSEAILFRHFATKEDLYHAILDMKGEKAGLEERNRKLQALMEARDDRGVFSFVAQQILGSFGEDPAFHRLLMYASLEGHLMANLFQERFVLPTGQLLGKYIGQRQTEGAFRACDPKVAVAFALSSFVHYAMSRHIFGYQCLAGGDDAALAEFTGLTLAALTVASAHDGSMLSAGKNQKGFHA
jgi:TetR/AcrR family transcriptional regulator